MLLSILDKNQELSDIEQFSAGMLNVNFEEGEKQKNLWGKRAVNREGPNRCLLALNSIGYW